MVYVVNTENVITESKYVNKTFMMSYEASWDIWCNMDFSSYPMDTQVIWQRQARDNSQKKYALENKVAFPLKNI